ncbi:hypothetical protein K1T71_012169 [Dendrolimus kikuchii]|uniref:Uncharacterized protein n=1 Tax=Dendrolimus kikuchii TaxID=765133 RepID=A0ACC1CKW9_9NEOP|nr:hypothetical protein K1T71_012169 [Dendrolimus kikuchii]
MKPTQCIEISDWVSCAGGLPLGSSEQSPITDLDVEVLFECEMEPHDVNLYQVVTLESMGQPVAWKAGTHLAIVLKTNIEHLSVIGYNFVGGEFVIDHKLPVVRVQTVQLSGEPNKATDPSMRNLRSDIHHSLKSSYGHFQWPVHASLLRKLSKVVDIKSDVRNTTAQMNGTTDLILEPAPTPKKTITLADVSVNTTKSLSADDESDKSEENNIAITEVHTIENPITQSVQNLDVDDKELVVENVTVEIQHNITPKPPGKAGAWRGRAALVAVAGCVGRSAPLLLAHLLDGGRLLALCSDLLHAVLPYYKTAEVRENEIVQFTYDKWKSVKMKHHIFCYQASPAKKQFSTESDRQPSKYTGHPGHELDIQVLASEETWRTPSLLQATDLTNSGIAIFSQIHLEADPSDYLGDEGIKSNEARLGIIHKILGDILGLHVKEPTEVTHIEYTNGFFLGNHVDKLSLVERWCPSLEDGKRVQAMEGLTIQWCLRDDIPRELPSQTFLPVFVFECPENFSTVEYYDNLTSKSLGRLVVYADVISSTMNVMCGTLAHGVGAVARRQTSGRGRGGNSWISPLGQAAMTLQIWQKMSPRVSVIQHAVALSVVLAIRTLPGYENLDLRIKWPNDIHFGRDMKIGGIVTTANCIGDDVIINAGTGVNISNSVPTTCVNDIISDYNKQHKANLAHVSIERFLALYCSQLEQILDNMETKEGFNRFLEQYHRYWLHNDEEIRVLTKGAESPVCGTITGIDDAGWLLVRTSEGVVQVAPDGNTFDLMIGLVAPKF